MKLVYGFLLLFILSTSVFAENQNRACWFNNSYVYLTKIKNGWLMMNNQGGMVYILSENDKDIGICNEDTR